MLHIMLPSDPSPLVQTTVYMGGMLAGYLLLTRPEEWAGCGRRSARCGSAAARLRRSPPDARPSRSLVL